MAEISLFERMLLFYGTRFPNHPRKWWVHTHLRQLAGAARNREIDVERGGLRWTLNPADFEHENLFWLGGMDKWDVHHLCALLHEDAVFYDIGANFGFYSLALANSLKKKCRINAFEPNPGTYNRLSGHISANGMTGVIAAHRTALSNAVGIGTLIERPDNSGAARLGEDSQGVEVEVTTLDVFCDRMGEQRLDAVKIDVEGYEVRVLEGAAGTLARFKPFIVIEFWTPGLDRAEATVDQIADHLKELGYALFLPVRDRLEPVAELPRGDVPVNIFAFHKDRPEVSFRV